MTVTNKKAILGNLVEINTSLTKITPKKFARINKMLLEEKSSASCSTPMPSTGHPDPSIDHNRAVSKICAAFKHKWVVIGLCSTHGWGVGPGRSSTSSGCNKLGHIKTATCKNLTGSGATSNKGWDFFMT